jgi:hypothetical protein
MKKLLILMIAVAFVSSLAFTQEEPIPPKRTKAPKVGLFGGFTPGWLSIDVAPVNEFLAGAGMAPLKDNGVFMYGGAGAIYIMVVKNLRVGGMGMSGSISSSTYSDVTKLRRDATLGVGFGGVTFEYVIPIVDRFDCAVGTMLGGGSMTLTLRQNQGGTNTWQSEGQVLGNWPTTQPINMTRTLDGSFFVITPSVNFEYAVLGWLGLRLGASYVFMLAPTWKVDNEYDLIGVPSSVKGNGIMVNAGILVGTF